MQRGSTSWSAWPLRFLLLSVIWGLSFLFIKVGDEALAPLQVALGRMACGVATLLLIVSVRRQHLPRGWRVWGHLAVAAVLLNAAPFSLFAYGEQHVSSVLAGIWNATTPLMTVPVAILVLPDEKPTQERSLGLAVGFVGVLVVLGVWAGLGRQDVIGNLMCLGAAASYGLGFPYTAAFLPAVPRGRCPSPPASCSAAPPSWR